MKLTVIRGKPKNTSTIGKLYIDGVFECYTLEDVIRPIKITGKTAIDEGTYKVIINMSNRFKKLMPLLLNVPNFEGVRVHAGNTSEDTEGCIIVGNSIGNNCLINSRVAYNKLFEKMQKAKTPITLEIKNEF